MATETVFNPKDNTTKEKFTSFKYVNSCYVQDRENLNKNTDFLGERKEAKQKKHMPLAEIALNRRISQFMIMN
ncbi:hypothetical protein [Isorropodon fossajaponicum symbiont]|uniref:hypothetical protein n=1 Tax=Isorropodon fossajaponicum symbiont TaxID=883811 RepID=UPI0019168AE0|nr:hypothetical protein [Isorropodon fossajaponicum symbiont]